MKLTFFSDPRGLFDWGVVFAVEFLHFLFYMIQGSSNGGMIELSRKLILNDTHMQPRYRLTTHPFENSDQLRVSFNQAIVPRVWKVVHGLCFVFLHPRKIACTEEKHWFLCLIHVRCGWTEDFVASWKLEIWQPSCLSQVRVREDRDSAQCSDQFSLEKSQAQPRNHVCVNTITKYQLIKATYATFDELMTGEDQHYACMPWKFKIIRISL